MPSHCFILAVMAERRKLGRQPRPNEQYVAYRGLRMLALSKAKQKQEENKACRQSHTSPDAGELQFDGTGRQTQNLSADAATLDTPEYQPQNFPVDEATVDTPDTTAQASDKQSTASRTGR